MADADHVSPCSRLPGLFLPKHILPRVGRARGRSRGLLAALLCVRVFGARGEALGRAPRVPHFPLSLHQAGMLITVLLVDPD